MYVLMCYFFGFDNIFLMQFLSEGAGTPPQGRKSIVWK
jgi:hypothetical protein